MKSLRIGCMVLLVLFESALFCNVGVSGSNKQRVARIGFWSSWNRLCGIAFYVKHMCDVLSKYGVATFVYSHDIAGNQLLQLVADDKIKVLVIQYEPSLFDAATIIPILERIKSMGIKIVLTVHNPPGVEKIAHLCDGIIYLNEKVQLPMACEIPHVVIPIGAPIFSPPSSRVVTRQKYGFCERDIILATVGFMFRWKRFPEILEKLVPWLRISTYHKIQLLTTLNNSTKNAKNECTAVCSEVKKIIVRYGLKNQVVHLTDGLSQSELSERLWISDLGYLWGTPDTPTSSAAIKEFISSRLPALTTNCRHFCEGNLEDVFIRVPIDENIFVAAILNSLDKRNMLCAQRKKLKKLYDELNYKLVGQKFLKYLEKVECLFYE